MLRAEAAAERGRDVADDPIEPIPIGEVPAAPDIAQLEALFAAEGVEVSALQAPERF